MKLCFTRIRLENWRNFRQAEAELGQRVFLIGPNAAGKSNFLDAFRFLHDVVDEGGLGKAVNRRGGDLAVLRCLSAPKNADVGIHVWAGDEERPKAWEYELRFNEKGGRLVVQCERVAEEGREILNRPDERDTEDPERLTQTHLEQVNVNREFREVADLFKSVRYLHIVPQLVREGRKSWGLSNDPYGRDFLEQLARSSEKTRVARLERVRELLRIAVPGLKDLEFWRDDQGMAHLRAKFENWRGREWQTEDQLSDGTLRLIGLLWIILEGSGPLLLEEPELSLHSELVRRIPSMIYRIQRAKGRQILISTHSFDLLGGRGIGLDEVLLLVPGRKGTEVCSPKDFEQVRILVESGMDVADAVWPLTEPSNIENFMYLGDES